MNIFANANQRRFWVRCLFAGVLLYWAFGYAFTRAYTEAYPLLMMPSFGTALTDEEGQITSQSVDVVVIPVDGKPVTLTPEQMAGGRSLPAYNIFRWMFSPPRERKQPDEPEWEAFLKRYVFRGMAAMNEKWYSEKLRPETKQWVFARARAATAMERIERVEFRWFSDTYVSEGAKLRRQRELNGVRRVEISR